MQHPRYLRGEFDLFLSGLPAFPEFSVPRGRFHPLNFPDQTLTPSLFNAFPLHSNANKKVIYIQCTSVLFSRVFAYTEPRPTVPILSGSAHINLRSATHRPCLPFVLPTALAVCPALSHHFRSSPFHFLVLTNSFRINTCGPACKCGKQRTYRKPKSFTCNTYKKHRGGGVVMVNKKSQEGFLSRGSIASEGPLPRVTSH